MPLERKNEILRLENDCGYRGYKITVKQKNNGHIAVILTHKQLGHTFEGDNSTGRYDLALTRAYNRMVTYENRHA